MPQLPDIKSKFVVDTGDLAKAEKASAKAHATFQEGAKASTAHTLRFKESLTTLVGHLGGLPPVADSAARSLESMSSQATQGLTGMSVLAGGALAAFGIAAEGVHSAIDSYVELGDRVEDFRRVTGASAEESSRLVHVFTDLGVSSDVASQGMFKLSKAIETTPKKLSDIGVAVAYNASGNVDLTKTLFSVADAYNATADPAKRNLLLFDAFGKSGRDMIPILEQGSAALQRMEGSASLLFSAADLERLKQAKIHSQEIKSAWEEFWAAEVGGPATSARDSALSGLVADAYAHQKLVAGLKDGSIAVRAYARSYEPLLDSFRKEYYASQDAKEALDSQSQATADLAAKNEALVKTMDDVINKQATQRNDAIALEQANLDVAGSADKITEAQVAYNKAVTDYGADSTQARDAQRNLERATIDQEKAYYAAANAALALQENMDLASGSGRDAGKESQAYVDKLQAEADTLAPNSPLRKNLEGTIAKVQEYIDTLNTTPSFIATRFVTSGEHGGGTLTFAGGGRPPVGEVVKIGEGGPEFARFDQPATIYPNGMQPGMETDSSGGDIHVHGPLVQADTNADAHDIATETSWVLRTMRRAF